MFADAAGGLDPTKTIEYGILALLLTQIGVIAKIWSDGRMNKLQQRSEHAKWLRDRLQQTFDAVAVHLQTQSLCHHATFFKLRELAAPLSYLDSEGELFGCIEAFADRGDAWFRELDCMNSYNSDNDVIESARDNYEEQMIPLRQQIFKVMRTRFHNPKRHKFWPW